MKFVCVVLLCGVLLGGCAASDTFETVSDVQDVAVSAVIRELSLTLPEGVTEPVMESGNGGRFYLCDGYSVTVSTFPGGDMERTFREVTGHGREDLSIMQTLQEDYKRYECAWSAAGEEKQQICRTVILNDGTTHHAVTVMCDYDRAGSLREAINDVLDSVKLVSTD